MAHERIMRAFVFLKFHEFMFPDLTRLAGVNASHCLSERQPTEALIENEECGEHNARHRRRQDRRVQPPLDRPTCILYSRRSATRELLPNRRSGFLDAEQDVPLSTFDCLHSIARLCDEMRDVDGCERIGAENLEPIAWRQGF